MNIAGEITNYWYRFISVLGTVILFSDYPFSSQLGLFFVFLGLGVWSTQNNFNYYDKDIGGRENIYSILFKVTAALIAFIPNYDNIINFVLRLIAYFQFLLGA